MNGHSDELKKSLGVMHNAPYCRHKLTRQGKSPARDTMACRTRPSRRWPYSGTRSSGWGRSWGARMRSGRRRLLGLSATPGRSVAGGRGCALGVALHRGQARAELSPVHARARDAGRRHGRRQVPEVLHRVDAGAFQLPAAPVHRGDQAQEKDPAVRGRRPGRVGSRQQVQARAQARPAPRPHALLDRCEAGATAARFGVD